MHSFESLERRTLLSTITFANGILTIDGTAGNENYYVSIGAGNVLHVIDGEDRKSVV